MPGNRLFFNAVLWIVRAGARGVTSSLLKRSLGCLVRAKTNWNRTDGASILRFSTDGSPERFGDWNSAWRRFSRWAQKGVWFAAFEVLQDPEVEWLNLDLTVIQARACAAGAQKADGTGAQSDQQRGRRRGGFGTKIHAAVNGLGLPVRLILTLGQASDVTQAKPLIEGLPFATVIAGKGDGSQAVVAAVEDQGGEAMVPSSSNASGRMCSRTGE